MSKEPLHCHVARDPWDPDRCLRITIAGRRADGRIVKMNTPEFTLYDEDARTYYDAGADKHALSIAPETAQELMNELWNAGIRPTEGHGSTGQLAATERHLEDLRALVFKSVPPRGEKS